VTFPNGECGHIVHPNAITDPGPEPGDIPIQVPAWIVQRNWMNSNLVEAMMQTVPLPEVVSPSAHLSTTIMITLFCLIIRKIRTILVAELPNGVIGVLVLINVDLVIKEELDYT
jgi:hypothetical protein